ncbi:hypothetical protein C84B14_08842 [Salinisphaera sp. C84B14]|uniref:type II toxin-antitoxin system PemK/MazF family toxin n=1 Tax=Salinisphaera sp. C84B14 TaxID=1304155 RepID=UPI003341593A
MTLMFHPDQGTVLICDFSTGFKAPEMVKKRPVVIVSPRRRQGSPLYTVVPLSTTPPTPVEPYHHQIDPKSLPGQLGRKQTWAKCDMLNTVSLDRLDRVLIRQANGKRLYTSGMLTRDDWQSIRQCLRYALDLDASAS